VDGVGDSQETVDIRSENVVFGAFVFFREVLVVLVDGGHNGLSCWSTSEKLQLCSDAFCCISRADTATHPSVGGFVRREKEILILEKAFSFGSGWHIGAFDYGDASVVDEHF
jgi:hypothetical protein